MWEVQIYVFLLSPTLSLYGAVTKIGCIHEPMDLVFFKVFCCTIKHVPEIDTVNLEFVFHFFVHGVLKKVE